MMVCVTIKKARLVAKTLSDKFKELTMMRLSIIAMLKSVRTMLAAVAFHLRNQADGCQNNVSLPVSVRKGCMRYNQKVFVNPKDAKRYANSSDPSMDWSKHLGVGTYALMR